MQGEKKLKFDHKSGVKSEKNQSLSFHSGCLHKEQFKVASARIQNNHEVCNLD